MANGGGIGEYGSYRDSYGRLQWIRYLDGPRDGNSADKVEPFGWQKGYNAMRPRPTFAEIFHAIAKEVAKRSTCPRLSVGAVIATQDNQIISTGYNGSPSGLLHCSEVGCLLDGDHCKRAVHAEANALLQAAKRGVSTNGATLYVTHLPCVDCMKLLITAGVKRISYDTPYISGMTPEVFAMASAAGVEVTRFHEENYPEERL